MAHVAGSADQDAHRLAGRLATRVTSLLGAVPDGLHRSVVLPFDDPSRLAWAYWPAARPGVALHRLDRRATKEVHRLLATLLAGPAFARAVTIMGLDEVLDVAEGHASDRRHRDDYWVAVFGSPGDDRWGVRVEGHHVSVHATVHGGEVDLTPLFLGANPAVVRDGGRVVVAPLAPEEELGFALLHELTGEQRAAAVESDTAPDDIRTRNAARVDDRLASTGVPLSALTGAAARTAEQLLEVHLSRLPAGARAPDPAGARFAWAGASEPGVGHYYRLAAPRLLVELDNTQDGANHVHTVVREPVADFGGDPLAAHHRRHHGG